MVECNNWPFAYWQKIAFLIVSFGVCTAATQSKRQFLKAFSNWYRGLISDAGFDSETVISERKVYSVTCHAALLIYARRLNAIQI